MCVCVFFYVNRVVRVLFDMCPHIVSASFYCTVQLVRLEHHVRRYGALQVIYSPACWQER